MCEPALADLARLNVSRSHGQGAGNLVSKSSPQKLPLWSERICGSFWENVQRTGYPSRKTQLPPSFVLILLGDLWSEGVMLVQN